MLVVLIVPSINMVKDHERLAVFRLNKYRCTKGPGFVASMPLIDRTMKIALDDQVELIDGGMGIIRRRIVFVKNLDTSASGDMVRVVGFEELGKGHSRIVTSK